MSMANQFASFHAQLYEQAYANAYDTCCKTALCKMSIATPQIWLASTPTNRWLRSHAPPITPLTTTMWHHLMYP